MGDWISCVIMLGLRYVLVLMLVILNDLRLQGADCMH